MVKAKEFLKSGHPPTLFAAFLYFDFCFAVWVLNGAMAPFISETFQLSAAQKGFMISVPIMAGALMRFPMGILAQYIGRKSAAMVEMSMIFLAMLYGYYFVDTYPDVIKMGVLLGIAGASFGVALSLGSGWFPPKYKGLAMGIAGAGNSGTVLAVLFAPPLATKFGWHAVYGFCALFMLIPMIVMLVWAKEPPDIEKQSLKEHVKCLWEKDGWAFNFIYVITFGGFIGLASFLPTYFYDQFGVTKVEAGQLTMLAAVMGSAVRVVGGWMSDRWGGINTLTLVFVLIIGCMFTASFQFDVTTTTILFMLCFAAFGAGNGALFQLVPLRWPATTAVAGSMIGEVGALGGSFLPNLLGQSKQHLGTFSWGFIAFMVLAAAALLVLRVAQAKWTQTWVGVGGRVRHVEGVEAAPAQRPAVASPLAKAPVVAAGLSYKNVVYPVGGNSELADLATAHAAYLAHTTGAKITLLYAEDRSVGLGALGSGSPEWKHVIEEWTAEGNKILDHEEKRLRALNVANIEKVLRHGLVPDSVASLANEISADLILLASQKRSPLGKLLMGSHTYNIFTKTPCPVFRIIR